MALEGRMNLREEIEDIYILFQWMLECKCFTLDEIIGAIAWEYEIPRNLVTKLLVEYVDSIME